MQPELRGARKNKWLPQEEDYIRDLRENKRMLSWKQIAAALYTKFPTKLRSGTQCRDRYVNYLQFGNSSERLRQWTRDQELIIMEAYLKDGAQWKKISSQLQSRSQNATKNKFYSTVRRFIRKFNEQISREPELLVFQQVLSITNPTLKRDIQEEIRKQIYEFREKIMHQIFLVEEVGSPKQLLQNVHSYSKHSLYKEIKKGNSKASQKKEKKQSLRDDEENSGVLFEDSEEITIKRDIPNVEPVHSSQLFTKPLIPQFSEEKFEKQRIYLEAKIVELFANILYRSSQQLFSYSGMKIEMMGLPTPFVRDMHPTPPPRFEFLGNQSDKQMVKKQQGFEKPLQIGNRQSKP